MKLIIIAFCLLLIATSCGTSKPLSNGCPGPKYKKFTA
jgi:hypothetical protein